MAIFLYLRRALSSLRSSVGGPQHLNNLSACLVRCTHSSENQPIKGRTMSAIRNTPRSTSRVISLTMRAKQTTTRSRTSIITSFSVDRPVNPRQRPLAAFHTAVAALAVLATRARQQFCSAHFAILTARSSKRHGPLVLCLTGGKG